MSDDALKQHVAAMQRGARCAICPLYGCGQGPVMPEVRLGALLTIIGEAPGTTEVEEGRTFAGATSEVLTATLPEVGVSRQDCTYTNAILCRPPGGHMLDFAAELNKKHKKAVAKARAERVEPPPLITPQECCAPRLEQDIADSESRVLLALGSEGLKAAAHAMKLPYAGQKAAPGMARVTSIKKQHGSPVLAPDGRVLMSSLHPVFAGYGNNAKYMPVIREDLKRAGRIAKRGAVIDWYEPEFIIKPSHDTCINVMERMRTARALVTVDIETDGKDPNTCNIRCVGLGAVIDGHEVVIVIPLRHMDGRRWWSPADEQRIENALRELLESNPLAGQNLLFDTCVLLRLKLLITRGKRWFDCYLDEETEFLTSRGWRKYDDVRKEDQLATIAPNNTLEWQRYETRVDKQRQGHLLQLETQHTRAVVTPKHTVWHQKTKRDGTQLTRWQLTPAEQLLTEPGGDANVLRACRPALGAAEDAVTFDGVVLDAARLKLLGLAVGDGTLRFHDGRPYRLRVSQKVGGRAYAFLQKFTAWATSERQYEKREVWRKAPCTESMWEVVGSFAETVARAFNTWFGRYSVERRLPSWAFTLPLALRRALFEGLLLGDASEVRGATLFRSCSRQLADDVHALAVTLGIVSTLHRNGKCWVVSLHSAASNEVQVVTRETKDSVNGFASRRPDASYRVVCFVVPNHTLVTRSGGRPAFHGNTMLAHHNTSQSELPHDLGFIAARNFEAPRWKEDADAKSIDGVDDFWLHLYCMFRGTPVVMADGSTRLIEDLVREKSTAEVLTLQNGRLVARRITGWHKQEVAGQKWLNLRIERQRASERGIVCTPEHEVLVSKYAEGQTRWTPAHLVRPGDFVRLPQARLYEQSRDLIIGTLLGDTSLQFSPSFRGRELEAPEASVQGGHALDSELAQMKRELLPDLFTGSRLLPGREVTIDGRSGTAGPFLGIWSKQHRELAELYPLLYDAQGRRRLRVEVLDALNLGAIAWWFMDDGCRQAGQKRRANTGARGGRSHDPDSVVFSTQRYPKEDVEAAAAWFTRRFGKTYACADGTLRLSYKASAQFAREIAPYVFPAQRYKLPHGKWPEFDRRQYVGRAFIEHAVVARVATVEEFIPTPAMHARGDAETRYCLDVKDARSFFTPWGLVHNCSKDVLGEMRLVDPLARQVNEEGTALALKTDTLLAPTARDMGVLGLNIDEDRRRKFFDILDAKVSDQSTKLKLITGNPNFNPNAFKQVADFLYIKKGLSPPYATDGREWEELEEDEELEIDTDDPEVILAKAATNELALLRLLELGVDEQTRFFIEGELFYRGLQKCKSTYVGLKAEDENGARVIVDTHRKKGYLQTEFWLGKRHSILHPSWKLHITPTGRWATSPNVQNWPERIVFDIELYKATERIRAAETAEFGKPKTPEAGILNTRAMVVAPDEHILVGADYAAIELRLYAAMSGDALLLDAIQHGKDPHALNYATMQSRHPGDLMKWYDRVMTSPATVKKYLRIIAKRFGFLVIYGGQKDKLYRTMASDRNPDGTRSFPDLKPGDVEMWFDNWHRAHPETKRWHEAVVRAWSRHGFVATILDGRRRFFLGGMDMTAMPNMTIQGSAASIANRAMIRVAEQCPHRGWSDLSGPVLQVHDFIGLQVPLKRQKEAEALLMREMPYEYNGMKYEVEQKSGLSWDKT